jgi:hypothetical protein
LSRLGYSRPVETLLHCGRFYCAIIAAARINGMNPIDLIVTVCAVLSPATCEETHLVFSYSGSLQQCVMAAPPYIAQWVGEHPKWNAVRWRCEYPHPNDKADAGGTTPAG